MCVLKIVQSIVHVHTHKISDQDTQNEPLAESESESDEEGEGLTTEQLVQEALQNLPSASDIQVELRLRDKTEEQLVTQFAVERCRCSRKCSAQFSALYIRDMRAQCYDLSHGELDMVLLGQLMGSTNVSHNVVVESGHLEKGRQKNYTTFHHAGKIVCGKTFRFLHTVGRKRMYHLVKSLLKGEWAHTTNTWKHTQMAKILTASRVN